MALSVTMQRTLFHTRRSVVFTRNRCFSSVDASNPTEAEKLAAAASASTRATPERPLFPWRHEPSDQPLLPRLTKGTPEFMETFLLPPPLENLIAFLFLGNGLFASLRPNWRDDLAAAAGAAFTHGVAAMLSSKYQVELTASPEEGGFEFSYPPEGGNPADCTDDSTTCAAGSGTKDGATSDKDSQELTDKVKSSDGDSKIRDDAVTNDELEKMINKPLLDLYQSARTSGKDQIKVRLHTLPTKAWLFSVFCIPFLTREHALREPDIIKETIEDITSLRENPAGFSESFERSVNRVETILRRSGKGTRPETTVEIQVLVQCDEVFQVCDATTGAVLQGSQDGAITSVFHLVRFETTVKQQTSDYWWNPFLDTQVGDWKMTDIDDLLGTKTWYQVKDT